MSTTIILMVHQREVPTHKEQQILMNNTIWFMIYWTRYNDRKIYLGLLSPSLPPYIPTYLPTLHLSISISLSDEMFLVFLLHLSWKSFIWGRNWYMGRISCIIISISHQGLEMYSLLKCHKYKEKVHGRSHVAAWLILMKMVLCSRSQINFYVQVVSSAILKVLNSSCVFPCLSQIHMLLELCRECQNTLYIFTWVDTFALESIGVSAIKL
jgi:hypothetical protein